MLIVLAEGAQAFLRVRSLINIESYTHWTGNMSWGNRRSWDRDVCLIVPYYQIELVLRFLHIGVTIQNVLVFRMGCRLNKKVRAQFRRLFTQSSFIVLRRGFNQRCRRMAEREGGQTWVDRNSDHEQSRRDTADDTEHNKQTRYQSPATIRGIEENRTLMIGQD